MKKYFNLSYNGNDFGMKNSLEGGHEVYATSAREAVAKFFAEWRDDNYFPKDNGEVWDCDGNVIAGANDDYFDWDGGYITAEEVK